MSEPPLEAADPTHPPGGPGAPVAVTGSDEVDAIVATMARLGEMPVADHVAVYEQVHGQLRAALARPPAE